MEDTVDSFNKKLDQLKIEFQNEFLKRVAARTPVRTGALQAGWYWDNSNPDLPIFSNIETYAIYVENGTPNIRPSMMVATTLLESPEIMKTAAKKVGF